MQTQTTTTYRAEWRYRNRGKWDSVYSDKGVARFNDEDSALAEARKWRRSFPTALVRVVKEEVTRTATVIEVKP